MCAGEVGRESGRRAFESNVSSPSMKSRPAQPLSTAANRAQTHPAPGIGRNEKWCSAQIMPATAHEHAKQRLAPKVERRAPKWCRERNNCKVGAQMKGGIGGNYLMQTLSAEGYCIFPPVKDDQSFKHGIYLGLINPNR